MKKLPHIIHIQRATPLTVRPIIIHKDAHHQHYRLKPDDARRQEEHGLPPTELDPIAKRRFTNGPLSQRMTAITAYLHLHYPASRGRPDVVLAPKIGDQWAIAQHLGRAHSELSRMAFYDPGTHGIFIFDQAFSLLDTEDPRARAAGTRIIFHEWFHSMRGAPAYPPFEEGAAEVFAREVGARTLGLPVGARNMATYQPLRQAVTLIGEHLHGLGKPFILIRESRSEPDQQAWMSNQLASLGVDPMAITAALTYNKAENLQANQQWLKTIQQVLKGR